MGIKKMKKLTRKQWQQRKKTKKLIKLSIVTLFGVAVLVLLCLGIGKIYENRINAGKTRKTDMPEISQALLTKNEYSRPGILLPKVKGVVVHYTANPGTTGWNNRDYFESLKDTHKTKASSHFVIGLDGTIIQCIPLEEISYASNNRNEDTISIECCHPKKNGKFTKETYDSLIQLTAWLAGEYNLKEEDIIRHYDVNGKNCPKYFVEHEDKWDSFKKEVFKEPEQTEAD